LKVEDGDDDKKKKFTKETTASPTKKKEADATPTPSAVKQTEVTEKDEKKNKQ